MIDKDYLTDRKIFVQVICSFRYGREEDEVMGLTFQKDLYLASGQVYPPPEKREENLTKLQVEQSVCVTHPGRLYPSGNFSRRGL